MKTFSACLKKDFLDTKRTYKFWVMLLCSVGMALMTLLLFVIMDIVGMGSVGHASSEEFLILFEKTYSNSIAFFVTFIMSYFLLIMIILYSNSISKEIVTGKWINPISAGIRPRTMILSKIFTVFYSIMVALLIGCLVHFLITIAYCSPTTESYSGAVLYIPDLLYSYAMLLIFSAFICLITVTLNAIIKKGWVVAVIVIVFLVLVSEILGSIFIGSSTLMSYSPFLFMNQAVPSAFGGGVALPPPTAVQWIVSSLITVGICALLFIGALFSNKVKAYEK